MALGSMRLRSVVVVSLLVTGCRPAEHQATDSSFADVQRRGETVMGVDQYTSKHVFEDLPDGGRIVLDRYDASDTAAVRTIRAHMRTIETAFQRADFTLPGVVHAGYVPGTRFKAQTRSMMPGPTR